MAERAPVVQIKPGRISGTKRTLPNGNSWYCYKGIPYAEPPVGSLRFKPPVPLENFRGQLLDCSSERNVSLSNSYIPPDSVGSEDCLFLNVYTPVGSGKGSITAKLPVMVWIHGGAFCSGSGDSSIYNPEYLVQEGVVVVTINYRLGPLGFLYLPAVDIYGNMGLKDQRLALKWVRDNITSFGGDRDNVTLFGESAGGVSVHLHCLSDDPVKHFHKAICQSGVATSELVFQKDPEVKTRRLAQFIGCRGNTDQEILDFLHYISAEDIASKQKGALTKYEQTLDSLYPFKPVIEPANSEDPFITEQILNRLKTPGSVSIPMIFGVNSEEAAYKASSLLNNLERYKKEPGRFIPESLDVPEDFVASTAGKILKFYCAASEPSEEKTHQLTRIFSDNFYVMPALVALDSHKQYHPDSPLFFYQFAVEAELNKFRQLWKVPDDFRGACHADDICYLFSSSYFFTKAIKKGCVAERMRTVMCRMWTNFAKCGHPTPEGCGLRFTWEQYESKQGGCLQISHEDVKMVENPFKERLEFWKNLYGRYNESFLKPKLV
ncbi:carboxylesterase 2 [Culex quinquefasciatus]|uniref:Carboxylic ester hydrolase n=1 Tax=Culex quinquefasciatus TaxID=7176 RepID=B0WLA7_CULQU|nr:carboxylesterase 2 [Culex quinquefasciatus]|eukprot:XP_001849491.1 carboxylesterase 2 [Culex quinquefasciatus]